MDIDFVLALVARWMHILAAITAVGGTIFQRVALVPAVAKLADGDRRALAEALRSRWSKFVMASIAFLLISGFYNFLTIVRLYDLPRPWYHALFGVKFLLALAIFFIASVLAGRSEATQKFRDNAKSWLTVNMCLAILLVMISGALKVMPHTPKTAAAPPATGAPAP